MLILRGINFGSAIGASGIQGYFGEGYAYHKLFYHIPGFSFDGLTIVSKTATLAPHVGNMPLKEDGLTPSEWKPKAVFAHPFRNYAVNNVALSNPGLSFLLAQNKWQKMQKPFFISLISLADTREERIAEAKKMVELLTRETFAAPYAIQWNASCPNTGHADTASTREFFDETNELLNTLSLLKVPIVLKLNALADIETIAKISHHPYCDGFCVSNTIPWSAFEDKRRLGRKKSPLLCRQQYFTVKGEGGVSGRPIFNYLSVWLEASQEKIGKPIIAGGGIMSVAQVDALQRFRNVKAISPGSVAFLRPWNLQKIIKRANTIFG